MIKTQLTTLDFEEDKWYVDSGATKHVSPHKKIFGKPKVVERSSVKTTGAGLSLSRTITY